MGLAEPVRTAVWVIGATLSAMCLAESAPTGQNRSSTPPAATLRQAHPQPHNRIDEICWKKLKELRIPPSKLCTDEFFLRRVYLDTIGTLPTPDESRRFLADPDPAKRQKLIDHLLNRPEFADYWALKWGDLLRIKSEYPVRVWPKGVQTYYRFVRQSIASNKPYDQFVTELLTATGSNFRDGASNYYRAVPNKDPQCFAETTALLFMGVRLECARCHAHPHEPWSLKDNLAMAAFFGQVKFKSTGEWKEEIVYIDPDATFKHPATQEVITPRFLNGPALQPTRNTDLRVELAKWLTAPDNPWFSRNIANRVWYWLLGRGLIEEPDDFRPSNPPTNPELLDFLAHELVVHNYDLKHLYRLILNSATYQLASSSNPRNAQDTTHYSHYLARRLPAEVLLDAISQVTQTTESYTSVIPEPYTKLLDFRAIHLSDGSIGSAFLELFGRPPRDVPYESHRCSRISPRQILYLINSPDMERRITASRRLRRLVAQRKPDAAVIEELYLAAFCRFPTPTEKQTLTKLIRNRKPRNQALQDLMWAILNSKEFILNH